MDIVTVTGQALMLFGLALAGLLLARISPLDKTLGCLLMGFAAGLLIPQLGVDTGIRAHNVQDLVYYVILPPLIFQAAWHIRPQLLRRYLLPILLLAVLGLLLSTLTAATGVYYGINHPTGFPWIAALLTGAILAATDPVSVVSQLQASGAPPELGTVVEGESLFNDATAVVLFGLMLNIALDASAPFDAGAALLRFAEVFAGGLLVGALLGLAGAGLVWALREAPAANLVLVLCAYAGFYIGEHLLHVSGIMAVMGCALVARALLQRAAHASLRDTEATWAWLGEGFNALLFTLMGLVITPAMFSERWLAMLIAIAAALLARVVSVYGASYLSAALGQALPGSWRPLLVWGGLRGSIGIALVLSLPVTLDYWWTIQAMVFGVVLFSLLVQGTTVTPLMRRLKLV